MKIIQAHGLSKIYGEKDDAITVEALKDVDLSVDQGEFVSIIGTSGSGKSTLVHLLAGLDRPTKGNIIINDVDITTLNVDELALFRRREIGFIYQAYNLIPVLTAKENILLPLMLDEKEPDQEYFDTIIDLLDIKDRLDFYPNKLSGGEQQRIAIARALIHQPSIIFADEPTGNLNSEMAHQIIQFLSQASKKFGQTIVMITHDLTLTHLSDRVIRITDGEITKQS